MTQTRKESLVEAIANQASGFVVAWAVTAWVVVPLWHLRWSQADDLTITLLFTAVSIVRSYLWRRYFNAIIRRRMQHASRN